MTSVNKIKCYGFYIHPNKLDNEYRRILEKLKEYGMSATGNKEIDKARLNQKEIEKVEKSNSINPELLTVSFDEQVKIQTEKNSKETNNNNNKDNSTNYIGQQLLGEQLMIAINMKTKKT